MSEMIERVAAALWEKLGSSLESYNIEMGCGRDSEKFAREEVLDAARAAIEAMREPTADMLAAYQHPFRTVEMAPGLTERFEVLSRGSEGNWRAMIDAALGVEPK